MTNDIKAIADGLSDNQRSMLMAAPRIGGKNPRGAPTWLCDHGLANCTIQGDDEAERWSLTLTPLGLQVRDYLLKEKAS